MFEHLCFHFIFTFLSEIFFPVLHFKIIIIFWLFFIYIYIYIYILDLCQVFSFILDSFTFSFSLISIMFLTVFNLYLTIYVPGFFHSFQKCFWQRLINVGHFCCGGVSTISFSISAFHFKIILFFVLVLTFYFLFFQTSFFFLSKRQDSSFRTIHTKMCIYLWKRTIILKLWICRQPFFNSSSPLLHLWTENQNN